MELKTIEMQIALPRTQDASKLQEQLQQRGQLQQDQIQQSVQKDAERLEKSVVREERKDMLRFHKENMEKRGASWNNRDKKKQKGKDRQQTVKHQHPYKGTRIDYCG